MKPKNFLKWATLKSRISPPIHHLFFFWKNFPTRVSTAFINFLVLFWGKQHFPYKIRNFKKQSPEMFLKNPQNWWESTRVFNSVYFSPRANISFQLSIYQVIFLNQINLFLHCFSTFFPFHKLQLCSYKGKFWYIYVIGIKINKKSPSVYSNPPRLYYFTEFSNSPNY